MAKRSPGHHLWGSIDQTSDPQWYIRFLDASRAQAVKAAESDPWRYFAYLDVQEGHHVLDVGCGTGDFVRILAPLLGAEGKAVGVDYSAALVAEARRRAQGAEPAPEFQQGDAQNLYFADNTFDRCQANAVFQHLADPRRALSEMVRVSKPGARVVVTEHDWETFVVSIGNPAADRKYARFFSDSLPNGGIAHHLPVMCQELGLLDVSATPTSFALTDYIKFEQVMDTRGTVARACQAGVFSEQEAEEWLAAFERKTRTGQMYALVTVLQVSARKP